MKYLLDINIVLIYTQNSLLTKAIESTYNHFNHLSPEYLRLEWGDTEKMKKESKM